MIEIFVDRVTVFEERQKSNEHPTGKRFYYIETYSRASTESQVLKMHNDMSRDNVEDKTAAFVKNTFIERVHGRLGKNKSPTKSSPWSETVFRLRIETIPKIEIDIRVPPGCFSTRRRIIG